MAGAKAEQERNRAGLAAYKLEQGTLNVGSAQVGIEQLERGPLDEGAKPGSCSVRFERHSCWRGRCGP